MSSTILICGKSISELFYESLIAEDRWQLYLKGMANTLVMSLLAILIGVLIGLSIAVIKNVHINTGKLTILDKICNLYVTLIRGIPMMLQLSIMYFIVFASGEPVIVAAIAFGINSGAYVAEIFRAGILSVDKGQMEAGRSLGVSYGKTMAKIIIPQALKNSIPPLGNEFIALIKETAIVGGIAIVDLTKAANNIGKATAEYFIPLIIAAIFYLVIVIALTQLMKFIERRLSRSDKR